jgi:hypothetical protein
VEPASGPRRAAETLRAREKLCERILHASEMISGAFLAFPESRFEFLLSFLAFPGHVFNFMTGPFAFPDPLFNFLQRLEAFPEAFLAFGEFLRRCAGFLRLTGHGC